MNLDRAYNQQQVNADQQTGTGQQINQQQLDAISAVTGPILVSAGAGTGKTTVLTNRIRRLIDQNHAEIHQILVVTFTTKAAAELSARLASVVDTSNAWIGTFHSLCLRTLRADFDGKQCTVIGKEGQKQLIKKLNTSKFLQPYDILEAIDVHKNTGQPIHDAEMRGIYNSYEQAKVAENLWDYSDLLIQGNKLLDNPTVAQKYHDTFRFVCVDEYQDTNRTQYQWLCKLLNHQQNIFCVGDEDQAIFEWRGSDPNLIKDFKRHFPGAQILKLETNYRSTSNILSAANCLIKYNRSRIKKVLQADNGQGLRVQVLEAQDEEHEANLLLDRLRKASGTSAILCRTTGLLRVFENALRSGGTGYKMVGTVSFYSRPEVQAVRAFAGFLTDPDDLESFNQIANLPRRGLGPKTLAQIGVKVANGDRLEAVARKHPTLQEFFVAVDVARAKPNLGDGLRTLLELAGYTKLRQVDPSQAAAQKRENVETLVARASQAKTVEEFHAVFRPSSADKARASTEPQIALLTIHAAKGLEFDNVALPGWEEGLLPHGMSLGEGKVEEERRLAYVAITRARHRLYISYAKQRYRAERSKRTRTTPSRFLGEIPMSVEWVLVGGG